MVDVVALKAAVQCDLASHLDFFQFHNHYLETTTFLPRTIIHHDFSSKWHASYYSL